MPKVEIGVEGVIRTIIDAFKGHCPTIRRPRNMMSGRRDLNPRPSRWQRDALPAELLPQCFYYSKGISGKGRSRTAISCFSDTRRDHLGYLAWWAMRVSNPQPFGCNPNP